LQLRTVGGNSNTIQAVRCPGRNIQYDVDESIVRNLGEIKRKHFFEVYKRGALGSSVLASPLGLVAERPVIGNVRCPQLKIGGLR
jgi:hypothetical protein